MRYGFTFCLGVCLLFSASSRAGTFPLHSTIATLGIGVTERKVDDDYASLLSLDKSATVVLNAISSMCTATFLSPTLLLTAAHCVDNDSVSGNVNVDGIESLRAYFSKKWSILNSHLDVALVVFPEHTGDFLGIEKYPPLTDFEVLKGDELYLVGYGMSEAGKFLNEIKAYAGAGIKGWGTTVADKIQGGLIHTQPIELTPQGETISVSTVEKKKYSFALPGDSGGAVYNALGQIAAVVSQVRPKEDAKKAPGLLGLLGLGVRTGWHVSNTFVDVLNDSTRALFTRMREAEANLPETKSFGQLVQRDLFKNVKLRTGFYTNRSSDEKTAFLHPFYSRGQIVGVDIAVIEKGAVTVATRMKCQGEGACADYDKNIGIFYEGESFRLMEFKPMPGNPNRRLGREVGQFDF